MDTGLYHLFLYATILLTTVTAIGILYYLKDRKTRNAGVPDLGDQERLLVLEQEITRMRENLNVLLAEQTKLKARIGQPHLEEKPVTPNNQSPRST
ncbi:MAG: hypothetical protein ACYC9S_08580 [Leptospirales bacterium]